MAGDIQLTCSDCGQDFTFTAADQAFFQERGYSTPKRCKPCRMAKKNDQGGGGSGYRSAPAQGTPVICSGCGSLQQCLLNRAATGRYFAGIATRRARAAAAPVRELRADADATKLQRVRCSLRTADPQSNQAILVAAQCNVRFGTDCLSRVLGG